MPVGVYSLKLTPVVKGVRCGEATQMVSSPSRMLQVGWHGCRLGPGPCCLMHCAPHYAYTPRSATMRVGGVFGKQEGQADMLEPNGPHAKTHRTQRAQLRLVQRSCHTVMPRVSSHPLPRFAPGLAPARLPKAQVANEQHHVRRTRYRAITLVRAGIVPSAADPQPFTLRLTRNWASSAHHHHHHLRP